MKETFYLKLNGYLLLTIIPLSMLGYYFAVHNESMFFLYEWLLVALVIMLAGFSIRNIVLIRETTRWVAISILTFLMQFSVLGLFLGPFSYFLMIYLYYAVAILSIIIFIITMRKNKTLKSIPIILIILTGFFTLYMVFLNMIWGSSLS